MPIRLVASVALLACAAQAQAQSIVPALGGNAPSTSESTASATGYLVVEDTVDAYYYDADDEEQEASFLLARRVGAHTRVAIELSGQDAEYREGAVLQAAALTVHPDAESVLEGFSESSDYASAVYSSTALTPVETAAYEALRGVATGSVKIRDTKAVARAALPAATQSLLREAVAASSRRFSPVKVRVRAVSAAGYVAELRLSDSAGVVGVRYLIFDREGGFRGQGVLNAEAQQIVPRAEALADLRDFAENAGESRTVDPQHDLKPALRERILGQLPADTGIERFSQQGVGRVVGYVVTLEGSIESHYFTPRGELLGAN